MPSNRCLPPLLSRLYAPLLLTAAMTPAAWAADWMVVANDRIRRVELDRASVLAAEAGSKVAWGRIVISDNQARVAGYKIVKALNRYDCRAHTFTIVKRVYLSDENTTLREDRIDSKTPISIKTGTVDERFFQEVCKPESVADLKAIAQTAARRVEEIRAEAANKAPALRNADMKLANEPLAVDTATVPPPKRTTADLPFPIPLPNIRPPAEHSEQAPPAPRQVASASKPVVRAPAPTPGPSATAAAAVAERVSQWAYSGAGGPDNWGKLKPEYAQCLQGSRQSPIDIRDGIKVDQEALQFDYKPSHFQIEDTGHTIQVGYGKGSALEVMGRRYELTELHFHHPAEERINGQSFAMSAHLIHRDAEGKLAVVAVLLEAGQAHALIQTLWNNLPLEKRERYQPKVSIHMSELLPEKREYFSYMGSLTTPPCTEGVLWIVMKQPVQLSAEQIAIFKRFYAHNARPIQAAGDRIIKESR